MLDQTAMAADRSHRPMAKTAAAPPPRKNVAIPRRTSMHTWDAGQYPRFADQRTLPARDLLARIDLAAPRRIVDLGCGPGNSTAVLRERWLDAAIPGIDTSAELLAAARPEQPGIDFVVGDIAGWAPAEPCDLVFSN